MRFSSTFKPFTIVCLVLLFSTGCTFSNSSPETEKPSEETKMRRIPALVEEITVGTAQPSQINITVKGTFEDGCDVPIKLDQNRQENQILLEVYRELPENIACASVITEFEQDFSLEGEFKQGTYVVNVNGEEEKIMVD